MSKSAVCKACGCSEIDTDQARGSAVCVNCGSVIEDNFIVSEVNFAENSIGGTSVIGQFVPTEGGKSHSLGSSFRHGFGKESRAITLQAGKGKITALGGQLQLNQHCLDTAYNFFKMAVSKKLTRGRKTSHIVAACLYLVCRIESTPHMLLDLSDLLQVNVYVLGKTYLKLSQELHIKVPAIDPCLYIHRFAHKLEFNDKTHEVSMTALRLVARMKRDWMHTGRRPSGLCGAALLVSARLHNFNRTQKDIIRIVKVCDATLRKRLTEFEETPSGQLTIDEFNKIDLEEEQDPPSFTKGRRKLKIAQLTEMSKQQFQELSGEITTVQQEIEKALMRKAANVDDASIADDCDGADIVDRLSEENHNLGIEEHIPHPLRSGSGDTHEENSSPASRDAFSRLPDGSDEPRAESGHELAGAGPAKVGHASASEGERARSQTVDSPLGAAGPRARAVPTPRVDSPGGEGGDVLNSLLMPPPWSEEAEMTQGLPPSALSLGLSETIEECMQPTDKKASEEESGDLDLTGIDDREIDLFILSPAEVAIKTEIWTKENAEYLKQLEDKQAKEAMEKEQGITKEPKKRKKQVRKPPIQASTAGEAIEKLLRERKISSKINYEVLRDLNRTSGYQQQVPSTPTTPTVSESPLKKTLPVRPTASANKRPRPLLGASARKEVSAAKHPKLELGVQPLKSTSSNVVVESGPVEYAIEDGPPDSMDGGGMEEEVGGEYYEEETTLKSAAQLLGHGGMEDYQDGFDIDDLE
ncbi:transcription factor IIIB 90 kDa subunit-like [Acanthaster planci]|uniref:Transcription factor IIIB 90 kDa subunit n=1 Tax=Acanthaster planci TaxID=133434 RepID=A0A8B7Y533_ACAPL|nr:transcription factor IIIB 90 kDa subunit-like [Acanthaster planci]